MATERLGLIEYLQEEVARLEGLLVQARAALQAALGDASSVAVPLPAPIINKPAQPTAGVPPEPSGIRWQREAKRLFEALGPGVELNHDQVISRLVDRGVPAATPQARNNITTALARLNGTVLIRIRPGVYRLMTAEDRAPGEAKSE
jgi:hypothetical protein